MAHNSGGSGGDDFDWLGFFGDIYSQNQTQEANKNSVNAVNQGYLQQNPFAPYQPFMAEGLMNLMANPGQITETPGYQFVYDQGLQGLFAKQSSTGNRFSGRAMTESMQFGQGLASQMWNQEVNRLGQFAGANQPYSGGIQTGENLSSLGQQEGFNNSYFWDNLSNNFSSLDSGNNPTPYQSNDDTDYYTG